jgi:hypothetical protein
MVDELTRLPATLARRGRLKAAFWLAQVLDESLPSSEDLRMKLRSFAFHAFPLEMMKEPFPWSMADFIRMQAFFEQETIPSLCANDPEWQALHFIHNLSHYAAHAMNHAIERKRFSLLVQQLDERSFTILLNSFCDPSGEPMPRMIAEKSFDATAIILLADALRRGGPNVGVFFQAVRTVRKRLNDHLVAPEERVLLTDLVQQATQRLDRDCGAGTDDDPLSLPIMRVMGLENVETMPPRAVVPRLIDEDFLLTAARVLGITAKCETITPVSLNGLSWSDARGALLTTWDKAAARLCLRRVPEAVLLNEERLLGFSIAYGLSQPPSLSDVHRPFDMALTERVASVLSRG